VLAGSTGTQNTPALFEWDSLEAAPRLVPVAGLNRYKPEGIVVHSYEAGKWTVQCLSDDDDKSGGPPAFRSFLLKF
jgi:hypothetical protein